MISVSDVKRLLGKEVSCNLPRIFATEVRMTLVGYTLRVDTKSKKVFQQLIVQDKAGAEYVVRMENVNEPNS